MRAPFAPFSKQLKHYKVSHKLNGLLTACGDHSCRRTILPDKNIKLDLA